jgi:hypothetical protein
VDAMPVERTNKSNATDFLLDIFIGVRCLT